jgi:hypothetical protein
VGRREGGGGGGGGGGGSTHLDQDSFEVLRHGDAAELDAKVDELEARPLALDLCLLLVRVDARHLEHEEVEEPVGYQRHHLVPGLEDREDRGRLLRIV